MKNKVKSAFILLLVACFLTGCNNAGYKHATIKLTNGEIKTVEVESYFISGCSVKVTTPEGDIYSIAVQNCTLTNQ